MKMNDILFLTLMSLGGIIGGMITGALAWVVFSIFGVLIGTIGTILAFLLPIVFCLYVAANDVEIKHALKKEIEELEKQTE